MSGVHWQSKTRRSTSGQSVVEYVMLIAVLAGLSSLLLIIMPGIFEGLEAPLKTHFKLAYKFGDREACGFDDDGPPCTGSPNKHPRYNVSDSFRMFGRSTDR